MPTISKSAFVPYDARKMYQLVNDIARYPEFIPWCIDSEVKVPNPDEIRAKLTFSKAGIVKSFTTVNRLQADRMIEMRLLEGPFKQLEGFWRFSQQNGQCLVSLDLEFEFATKLLALMFGPVFNQVASMLVDAFVERANVLYGQIDQSIKQE